MDFDNIDDLAFSNKRSLLARILRDPVKDLVSDEKLADEVRGRQVLAIKRITPVMLLANVISIIATVFILAGSVNTTLLIGWTAFASIIALGGMAGVRFRWKIKSQAYPRKNTSNVVRSSMFLALIWAMLPVLFLAEAPASEKVFIAALVSGMMSGGTMALNIIPLAARAFCWIVGLGAIATLFISLDPILMGVGVLLIVYATGLSRVANEHGQRFVRRFIDKSEMERQQETISMLLKDFQDSSSDWMWECDVNGVIRTPSKRFCESAGLEMEQLSGLEFKSLVSLPQAKGSSELSTATLKKKLKTALVFRDHHVQINTPKGPQWWSLTGKPIVDEDGNLTGFRGTASDIQETKNAQEKLNKMALEDQLTGLSNHNFFYELLADACLRLSEGKDIEEDEFCLLYLDIDEFKALNDSLGHGIGDALLREVANRLVICVGEEDTVSRFGGDEFSILLRSMTGREGGEEMARRILNHLERPFLIQGEIIALGCSIGIVVGAPQPGQAPRGAEDLMSNAEVALSEAKANGGGNFKVFNVEMNQHLLERRRNEIELRSAIKEKEFVLHYQPVIDLASGDTLSYEALIRWEHPTRGELSPEAFLPFAEEVGLISEIGYWALEQACIDACSWKSRHRVTVNVANSQFNSQNFMMRVMSTLERTGLAAERLEIDVKEAALESSAERTKKLFSNLKQLGVGLSLDDFGSGNSSLTALAKYPFDRVKIDGGIIRGALQNEEDLQIMRLIIGLTKKLGIQTLAKGIENSKQLKLAEKEGCAEVQGFFIQKPMPLINIPTLKTDAKRSVA